MIGAFVAVPITAVVWGVVKELVQRELIEPPGEVEPLLDEPDKEAPLAVGERPEDDERAEASSVGDVPEREGAERGLTGRARQPIAAGSISSRSRPLSRRMALVCSCETRDSVTPSTSPISRSVRFS